jgi:CheY-like chemotaxis protein
VSLARLVDRMPAAAATKRRSALILDDEADKRVAMREGLADHGVVSDEADTLEEAIRHLASSSYDLVVCDLILCDPPDAANPALRGYLAVCFALARPNAIVVQASALRRWAHAGAVLTNWKVDEVANLVYGAPGIPGGLSGDGGCPWWALNRAAAARAGPARAAAAADLAQLPIVRELEGSLDLSPALEALEDAAEGVGDWSAAVAAARCALFPGAGRAG